MNLNGFGTHAVRGACTILYVIMLAVIALYLQYPVLSGKRVRYEFPLLYILFSRGPGTNTFWKEQLYSNCENVESQYHIILVSILLESQHWTSPSFHWLCSSSSLLFCLCGDVWGSWWRLVWQSISALPLWGTPEWTGLSLSPSHALKCGTRKRPDVWCELTLNNYYHWKKLTIMRRKIDWERA